MNEMQLEIDILKETIDVLKKDPGVDKAPLKNKDKIVIVDALKTKYKLQILLNKLNLPKSSYYYHQKILTRPDKYLQVSKQIKTIFYENYKCYGYRRIHGKLKKENCILSEKVIIRLMKKQYLTVKTKKKKKYSSYEGELTKAPTDLIKRNFHALKPNCKWLTDITEFSIPAGKIYLSSIVDCFDGLIPSWTISNQPNAILANSMLDKAIAQLNKEEKPIVHSDRGAHYRWTGWIDRMEEFQLSRSMSRKGCSPDNAACEGFFGRLKNELFYNQKWKDVSLLEFKAILNKYLIWYNEKRIKVSLNNMSPLEYRQSPGLASI